MIGRIIWFAALAGVALLTSGLQLDLMARYNAGLAPLVPEPLRNFAQVWIAESALKGEDDGLALTETRKLVHRRPVPAENLRLLAASQFKAGQNDEAVKTIQIAGQRGWREPAAQEAVLRLAIAAGDKPEAARRYAALFVNGQTPDALLKELGPAVLDGPDDAGRDAMVQIVVGGQRWHAVFLKRGAQVMPPEAFTTIAAKSQKMGAAFDCKQLDLSVKLLALRDKAAASQLAAATAKQCPDIVRTKTSGL